MANSSQQLERNILGAKKSIITQKVIVAALPIEIFQAFIDPKKHSDFTGSKATGKSSVGSKFTAWGGYIQGKILALEKYLDWRKNDFYVASIIGNVGGEVSALDFDKMKALEDKYGKHLGSVAYEEVEGLKVLQNKTTS